MRKRIAAKVSKMLRSFTEAHVLLCKDIIRSERDINLNPEDIVNRPRAAFMAENISKLATASRLRRRRNVELEQLN